MFAGHVPPTHLPTHQPASQPMDRGPASQQAKKTPTTNQPTGQPTNQPTDQPLTWQALHRTLVEQQQVPHLQRGHRNVIQGEESSHLPPQSSMAHGQRLGRVSGYPGTTAYTAKQGLAYTAKQGHAYTQSRGMHTPQSRGTHTPQSRGTHTAQSRGTHTPQSRGTHTYIHAHAPQSEGTHTYIHAHKCRKRRHAYITKRKGEAAHTHACTRQAMAKRSRGTTHGMPPHLV